MVFLALIIVFLMMGLVGIAYWIRRQEQIYEKKSVKETLSPMMKHLIELEREENQRKKEHFEAFLHQAEQPELPQPPSSDDSSSS